MKTNYYLAALVFALLFSVRGFSQINYTQNFEVATNNPWNAGDWGISTYTSCNGTRALEGYAYNYPDWEFWYDPETISPSLGTSNGQLVTFTYNYKIWNWDDSAMPNSPDWGSLIWEYSSSASGPWTTIQTINASNHVSSLACAPKTATFTPAAGTQVYLRVRTEVNLSSEVEFYLYVDDLSVTQAAAPGCTGTPAAANAVAANTNVCNTENAQLSLSTYYSATGITYQWQQSADNVTYTNITGATSATLSTPQTAATWYRAIITCTGSSASVNSAPVQVTMSGLPCKCNVTFGNAVEPITNVTFATINNTTSETVSGTPAVQTFATPVTTVYKGQSYPISLQGNTDGDFTNYFRVYIDFNQNGSFDDAGESFDIGTIDDSTGLDGQAATSNILIPAGAATGQTWMRVFKLFNVYPATSCGAFGFGQVEDYLLNIQNCTTAAPTATAAQTYCGGATVASLVATGTVVKWYAAATGGTALAATTPLVNGTTYYASQTVGCESTTRTAVTVTITTVSVDDPADVNSCEPYTLPALTNGVYRTATNGGGTVVAAGTVVSATTTYYIYNTSGTCSAENAFVVTIGNISADAPEDVAACGTYTLPALTSGTYHTAPNGGGSTLAAGSSVNATATLYVYASAGNCTDENSFTVTILNAVADDPADVAVCGSYILPELTNPGIYTTEAGGQGDLLQPGDEITETTTIYIYSEVSEGAVLCTAENSFTVTVNTIEADELDDVTACGEFVLPELENGAYFTGGSGLGQQLQAGDVITSTTTLHIFAESGTTPNCIADTSFTITIVTVEADVLEDASVDCTGYTLPALSAGNAYYTGSAGTGTQLNAGDVITASQTIYIYAASSTSTPCYDESSFMVDVVPVETPEDITVQIVTEGGLPVAYDLYGVELGVELEGTITFYATEDDAINGVNPLDLSAEVGQTTTYYATITVGGCVSEPFAVTFDIVLDRNGFDMAAFSYHPNPVSDVLNVNYSENITDITVFDIMGKKVLVKSFNQASAQVDFSGLASGVYTMKVQTETASKTVKIVKNR